MKDLRKIALTHIRSNMRKTWLFYSEDRKEALNKAKVSRGKYRCSRCSSIFGPKEVQVDHVKKLGTLNFENLGVWVFNLMFGEMQVLCKPCHYEKGRNDTNIRAKLRRNRKISSTYPNRRA